jgi:hypothetical protein
MPPADVVDGGWTGNKGSVFPQYIPYFIAVVALSAKIDNAFFGLQVNTACAILGSTPLRDKRIGRGILPVAVINFHKVLMGEPMIDTKVPDGLESCTFPALDSFVLLNAALHPTGKGVRE